MSAKHSLFVSIVGFLAIVAAISIVYGHQPPTARQDPPTAEEVPALDIADAEAAETIGQAIRHIRRASANADEATLKFNAILDRIAKHLDAVERGEVYLTIQDSIGEKK